MSRPVIIREGKEIELTYAEIDTIYRYKEKEFLKEDAYNQTKDWLDLEDDEMVINKIEEVYGGTVEEYIEYIVEQYMERRDMSVDFNSTFQYIIESIFE